MTGVMEDITRVVIV